VVLLWLPLLPAARADTLLMTTGERLHGRLVGEEGEALVFESDALGVVRVPRVRVESVSTEAATAAALEAAAPEAEAPAVADVANAAATPAEEDRTASELPPDRPPPPSAPDTRKKEDLLRLWVDQGLRYQIVQPVVIWRPFQEAPPLMDEEVRMTGRIGIRGSVDAAGFETSRGLDPIGADVVLRALRFYTTGEFGPTSSYAVQFGVIDGAPYLHQASLRWTGVPRVHNVSFGYLGIPQTLENVLPFGGAVFMEPPLPVLAFAPGNRMGLQIERPLWAGRASLTAGIYSLGADPGLNFGDQTQSLVRPTARFTGLVWDGQDDKGQRRLLHLGVSTALTVARQSAVRYRVRPESFVAPFVADTGTIDAHGATFGGAELVWMRGPVTVQGEAMLNRLIDDSRSYVFGGAYVLAAWALTGEQPGYNTTVGVPDRIIPHKDFSRVAGTWGAWQVAARYSMVDLTYGTVAGGKVDEVSLGLNWWWSRYLRWQLNYGYAWIQGGPTPGALQVLQGRMQLMY
jgi:phosphate-selective porin